MPSFPTLFFFSLSSSKILVFVDDRFFLDRLRCTVARQVCFTVSGRLPPLDGLKRKIHFDTRFTHCSATSPSPRNVFFTLGPLSTSAGLPFLLYVKGRTQKKSSRCPLPMDKVDVMQLFLHTRTPLSLLGGGLPR